MLPDQNEVMRRAEHERKLRYEAKLRAVSRRVRRVNGVFLSVCPFLFGFRELSFFFFNCEERYLRVSFHFSTCIGSIAVVLQAFLFFFLIYLKKASFSLVSLFFLSSLPLWFPLSPSHL